MSIHEALLAIKAFAFGAASASLFFILNNKNITNYRQCRYCKYFMHDGRSYEIVRGLCSHERANRSQHFIENNYYCGNYEMSEALAIDLQRRSLERSGRKSNNIFNQLKSKIDDK